MLKIVWVQNFTTNYYKDLYKYKVQQPIKMNI
jgi:hypothetical protein